MTGRNDRHTDHHVWQVSTCVDSPEAAQALALGAVGGRLAACAQVSGPVSSTFWWSDAVQTAQEWTVLLKTSAQQYGALEAYLRQAHPYEVPEILATAVVAGSAPYLAWVRAETSGRE
ncbi:MAG TPA: divalent-cation tolerance protein CutA [Kineosporiaceae bacterium]|nr:divalent-cation tolerance protein CutA [Kineosporiaceae bacterium]